MRQVSYGLMILGIIIVSVLATGLDKMRPKKNPLVSLQKSSTKL